MDETQRTEGRGPRLDISCLTGQAEDRRPKLDTLCLTWHLDWYSPTLYDTSFRFTPSSLEYR